MGGVIFCFAFLFVCGIRASCASVVDTCGVDMYAAANMTMCGVRHVWYTQVDPGKAEQKNAKLLRS